MPIAAKTTSDDYYDTTPTAEHRAGDIWENLPTHGILPIAGSKFLVITPACDLANRKVDSIAYLPIVTIGQYLASRPFYPQIISKLGEVLRYVEIESEFETKYPHSTPPQSEVEALEEKVQVALRKPNLDARKKAAYEKVLSGLRNLKVIGTESDWADFCRNLYALFGEKNLKQNFEKIVTNSFRTDLHFLPSDGQQKEWAGVFGHSVALFRYPLSCPIEILNRAHDLAIHDWDSEKRKLQVQYPGINSFHNRPIKKATVRPRFYADLYTRYLAMYLRLGSPDFTQESIERMVEEIGGSL